LLTPSRFATGGLAGSRFAGFPPFGRQLAGLAGLAGHAGLAGRASHEGIEIFYN